MHEPGALEPDRASSTGASTVSRTSTAGIVVNEAHELAVPCDEVRRLRAILHDAKTTGLAAQNRENRPNFEAWLRGKIAYVTMVDRARGEEQLLRALAGATRQGASSSGGSGTP